MADLRPVESIIGVLMCGLSPSLSAVRFPPSGLCPQAKPRGTQGNHYPSRLFLVLSVCSEFEQGTTLDSPEERDSSDSEELDTLHIPGLAADRSQVRSVRVLAENCGASAMLNRNSYCI
jgi:hypothetical protein